MVAGRYVDNLSAPVNKTRLKNAHARVRKIKSFTGYPTSRLPPADNAITKKALIKIGLTKIVRTSIAVSNSASKNATDILTSNNSSMVEVYYV
jgi:hypothetical protein